MSSTKRIGYIDIAKGIAFIFIVVGHVGLVFSSDAVQGGMPPPTRAIRVHLPPPHVLYLEWLFFPCGPTAQRGAC